MECPHQRPMHQPAQDLSSKLPILVTPLLSFHSPSPKCGSCFLQLLISALGVQEAVTNIQVILSFLSAVYPIRCIESAAGNTLHNFLFSCSFHTIVNTHLQFLVPYLFPLQLQGHSPYSGESMVEFRTWRRKGLGEHQTFFGCKQQMDSG